MFITSLIKKDYQCVTEYKVKCSSLSSLCFHGIELVSLPFLRISMTLSVHCHMCPLCCPFPPAVPAVPASCLWCPLRLCGDAHRAPFPCPFPDLLSKPVFSKRSTGKGPISKGCLGCGVSETRVKLLKKGFVQFWRQLKHQVPMSLSFWAHTLIYTGIFLSQSVSVTPVFRDPCIH